MSKFSSAEFFQFGRGVGATLAVALSYIGVRSFFPEAFGVTCGNPRTPVSSLPRSLVFITEGNAEGYSELRTKQLAPSVARP
jgi:hypothetical protein